jgi:NAD(P)-dependent dehydrogenase (short-subunit alcohol dehydrogenase family)
MVRRQRGHRRSAISGRDQLRRILITGAGSGIGRAAALRFAGGGDHVAVNDIRPDAAAETVALIRAAGGGAEAAPCDVADIDALRAMIAALGPLDVLVNNAGISSTQRKLAEIDPADFDRMFGVHVKAAFFAAQAVAPGMRAKGHGRIVNVSSNWALQGSDILSHYSGAKAALLGLTRAWAKELGPDGIRVNAVVPGSSATPLVRFRMSDAEIAAAEATTPLGRWATADEIAAAITYLASAEAAGVTGQMLVVNGGQYFAA